jgi:hypothetical protein
MSDRSWFYAAQGQQQGPFPEAQFRNLIARNTVTADTLVWTDGMAGWQRAGDIPGLMSGRSGPPTVSPPRGQPAASAAGAYGGADPYAGDRYGPGGGPLSFEPGLWEFLGQGLLYVIGMALVVPAPWLATGFYRWAASRTRIPDRPNFAFNGQPMDIWYALAGVGLLGYVGLYGGIVHLIAIIAQIYLSWMILRWIVSHFSSNGQPLPVSFNGSVLIYIGWHVLLALSAITIIGWAWVAVAQTRWICRNIGGTHREIVFNATGLEMLWRTLVFVFGCAFIIPIPWMMRWYVRWLVSQFELVDRA